MNPHFGMDKRFILKVKFKADMFVVKCTGFGQEILRSTGYFRVTNALVFLLLLKVIV